MSSKPTAAKITVGKKKRIPDTSKIACTVSVGKKKTPHRLVQGLGTESVRSVLVWIPCVAIKGEPADLVSQATSAAIRGSVGAWSSGGRTEASVVAAEDIQQGIGQAALALGIRSVRIVIQEVLGKTIA